MAAPDSPDRQAVREIVAALSARIDDLARYLLGEPGRRSSRREMVWPGGLIVSLHGGKRGLWYDHTAERGGDAISLIRYARQCDFPSALDLARQFLGLPDDAAPPSQPLPSPSRRSEAKAEDAEARAAVARDLWTRAEPVAGTLAERYLTEARGIPRPPRWPAAVRFHRGERALLLPASTWAGTVRAVQLVYLTADARNKTRRDGSKVKISRGALAGVAVRLPAVADGPLLFAEGPETGLSVWRASGWETWIACGSMGRLIPPDGRAVIVCGDDDPLTHPDPRKLTARRALLKAVEGWHGAGVAVAVARPCDERRGDKSDFNDLIRAGGVDAVRERLGIARDVIRERLRNETIPRALAPLLARHAPTAEIIAAVRAANVGLLLTKGEVREMLDAMLLRQMRQDARLRGRVAA